VCPQTIKRAKLQLFNTAFGYVFAHPPVLEQPQQTQTPPYIAEKQTFLLAISHARHVILVQTKGDLQARGQIKSPIQRSRMCQTLTFTRLLVQPLTKGLTKPLHATRASFSAFSRRRCTVVLIVLKFVEIAQIVPQWSSTPSTTTTTTTTTTSTTSTTILPAFRHTASSNTDAVHAS
jgi:hypothetical protein